MWWVAWWWVVSEMMSHGVPCIMTLLLLWYCTATNCHYCTYSHFRTNCYCCTYCHFRKYCHYWTYCHSAITVQWVHTAIVAHNATAVVTAMTAIFESTVLQLLLNMLPLHYILLMLYLLPFSYLLLLINAQVLKSQLQISIQTSIAFIYGVVTLKMRTLIQPWDPADNNEEFDVKTIFYRYISGNLLRIFRVELCVLCRSSDLLNSYTVSMFYCVTNYNYWYNATRKRSAISIQVMKLIVESNKEIIYMRRKVPQVIIEETPESWG